MTTLQIELKESKALKPYCRVIVKCSTNICHVIVGDCREVFEIEMMKSGSITDGVSETIVSFVLTDPEKIKKMKRGVMQAFLKHASLDKITDN